MFTAYTDAVLTVEAVKKFASVTDDDKAALLVNGVTDKFKAFCGRTCWLRGADEGGGVYPTTTEYCRGTGEDSLYLRGGPVTADNENDITVLILEGGQTVDTLLYSDNDVFVSDGGERNGIAVLSLASGCFPVSNTAANVKVTYVAGFAAIPADIAQLALEQVRQDLRRMSGEAGAENKSRQGESASFETGGLLKSVRNGLERYRII